MLGIICFVVFTFFTALSCLATAIDRKYNNRVLFCLSIDFAAVAVLLFPVSIVLLCLGF